MQGERIAISDRLVEHRTSTFGADLTEQRLNIVSGELVFEPNPLLGREEILTLEIVREVSRSASTIRRMHTVMATESSLGRWLRDVTEPQSQRIYMA